MARLLSTAPVITAPKTANAYIPIETPQLQFVGYAKPWTLSHQEIESLQAQATETGISYDSLVLPDEPPVPPEIGVPVGAPPTLGGDQPIPEGP